MSRSSNKSQAPPPAVDEKDGPEPEPDEKTHPVGSPVWFIDYLHVYVSPHLFACLMMLFALDLGDWTAYLLVSGGLLQALMIFAYFGRVLWVDGWFRYLWEVVRDWFSAAWIKALLGMTKLRGVWWGKLAITIGFANFVYFPGRWAYQHFDILRFAKATVELVRNLVHSLLDPIALMHDFRMWLSATIVGRLFDTARSYTATVTAGVDAGDIRVLFWVVGVSVGCAVLAVIVYGLWNLPYKKYYRYFSPDASGARPSE